MKSVSVIIPCRDRTNYLELSLASYIKQTYPRDYFEIILVDDGSNEHLPKKICKQWPVKIKVISNSTPLGAGLARHEGIRASSGEVIIFTDADMIVPEHFIEAHTGHHQQKDNVVVTSPCRHRIYTVLYPQDTSRKLFQKMTKINPQLLNRIPANFQKQHKPIQLFSRQDIEQGKIDQYIRHLGVNKKMKAFLKRFGEDLEECPIPWITFISYSASLSRKTYEKAGGFFKDIRYRHSDRALGYHLYLLGYSFICDSAIIPTHQLHPLHRDMDDWVREEYQKWLKKYYSREIYLFGLRFIDKRFRDPLFYSDFLTQMNKLEHVHPKYSYQFDQWIQAWIHYFIRDSDFEKVTKQYKHVQKELDKMHLFYKGTAIGRALRILKQEQKKLSKEKA